MPFSSSARRFRHTLLSLMLALAACTRVTVVGAGSKVRAAPRPPDCTIPFLRMPPPTPYDELGRLELETGSNSPGKAADALREKACSLGADAVVITKEFTRVGDRAVMTGTALRHRSNRLDPMRPQPSCL